MIYFEFLNQCCIFSEKKKATVLDGFIKFLFIGELIISYFYEYFNRLLDTYLYLWYNNCVEYLSPEAVYRSTVMPD